MVPKRVAGDWRPCRDNQALNKITIPDRYAIPHTVIWEIFVRDNLVA